MTTSSRMTEASLLTEINCGKGILAVAFAANGEYLVSGGSEAVRVWRVEDGKQMATLELKGVECLAVSTDGRWIAAGAIRGNVYVWDAKTYEKVFSHREDSRQINGIDFSPDSSRLVSASDNKTASIWDIATRRRVQTLHHEKWVRAAKYSPQGDRIATATFDSVRDWDSNDGRLLVEIKVAVTPFYNTGLLWSNNHLFVLSDSKIKQFEASTGSTVSEWSVADTNNNSSIALPKHEKFIAYSTNRTVTFWDTATRIQLGLIEHPRDIRSIALSPDDRFIAIGGKDGKITINSLSRITHSILLSRLHPTFQEPDIRTNDATLNSRKNGQPASAQALREWAKTTLASGEWKLVVAASFTLPRLTTYRVVCERLETIDRVTDAVECFHQMTTELGGETNLRGEHSEWALDFRRRCVEKLEHLGDTAVDAQQYDEAISHYSTALSLNPPAPQSILIKRSKLHVATGSWKQVVDDANQIITLDPFSPWGYEMKRAAAHKAGDFDNAVDALETMLSKVVQSPDPVICRHGDQYISPSSTRATIRKIVQRTIRHSPRVLINMSTGRLHNRAEQASAFESLPIFNELVSSMTTRIDYVRIKREVRQYFRYVMLSHKWEDNEPLFQEVIHMAVYDLDNSPTHDKLKMFCKIVRDAGFNWAWSDTCCINKSDNFVLQEALVAMFKWYQGSAMMIVFLRGVRSTSQRGALVRSNWNTRAWTLQEYVAAKVIHFYTEDWTLYLNLDLPNHKESPEVISEMEQATRVSAQQLMALRPGLSSVREKLCLASTRQTTLVEDAAYSLLSIFSVTGIPAIYGEGEGSLGRLLAHVLTGSGDVSILAWTGESGSYNSCLPAHITVFSELATSYLPRPIQDAEVERIVTASDSSPFDLDVALRLYDRLDELPAPWFAASRMKLPCIAFKLPSFSRSGRVYRADTLAFGTLEIKTRHDLSRMKSLYLVHPWLDTLLEREDTQSDAFVEDDVAPPPSPRTDDEEISDEDADSLSETEPESPSIMIPTPVHMVPMDAETRTRRLIARLRQSFGALLVALASMGRQSQSIPAPVRMVPMEAEMRARRLVARLRQPFGALLVTLASTGRRAVDYKRVAADCMITVQLQENVSLADLLDNVRTIDVL